MDFSDEAQDIEKKAQDANLDDKAMAKMKEVAEQREGIKDQDKLDKI